MRNAKNKQTKQNEILKFFGNAYTTPPLTCHITLPPPLHSAQLRLISLAYILLLDVLLCAFLRSLRAVAGRTVARSLARDATAARDCA